MKARLKFAGENVDKDQDLWNNVLWTGESKTDLYGPQNRGPVWHKPNTAFQEKNLIPTVKHRGGSVMVWGCFPAAGPGQVTVTESTMNSAVYQRVLEEHVRPSVETLTL